VADSDLPRRSPLLEALGISPEELPPFSLVEALESGPTMTEMLAYLESLRPAAEPAAAPEIDYEAIVAALLNANRVKPSRLVKLMSDRLAASCEDILEEVCQGDAQTWEAVKSLVNRTNNALHELKGPVEAMARRLKFKAADLTVTKIIKPA
jgi:hypothetical protein